MSDTLTFSDTSQNKRHSYERVVSQFCWTIMGLDQSNHPDYGPEPLPRPCNDAGIFSKRNLRLLKHSAKLVASLRWTPEI